MVVAGKDFSAVRTIHTWDKRRRLSLAMIALGVLMLGTVGGYYLYSVIARAQLVELEFTVPLDETDHSGGFSSIYPGRLAPSLFWDDPRWMDVDYDSDSTLFEGFIPVGGNGLPAKAGDLAAPTRIEIPSIGLGSVVKALDIVNYGDALGWETPKGVVGRDLNLQSISISICS